MDKHIALSANEEFVVSTVDLRFGLFEDEYCETMVFAKKDDEVNFRDLYCKRSQTVEEAWSNHIEACEQYNVNPEAKYEWPEKS